MEGFHYVETTPPLGTVPCPADVLERLDGEYLMSCQSCEGTSCSEHTDKASRKREYTDRENIKPEPKRLRNNKSDFNFETNCIFCGEECPLSNYKHPNRWKPACVKRNNDMETIMNHATERGDNFGNNVKARVLSGGGDLQAGSRYHKACKDLFYKRTQKESKETPEPIRKLTCEMQSNRKKIWNSTELYGRYLELGGGADISRRNLVGKVVEILKPDLMVFYSNGLSSILAFESTVQTQLRSAEDEDDYIARAISCLARVIREECPNLDGQSYKTRITKEEMFKECSQTLLRLLAAISPNLESSLQAGMIGSITTSCCHNKFTTLQMALSVLMSRQKALIDELHLYGVTSSYKELRRLRCSAAAAAAADSVNGHFDCRHGLIQVVADNFDSDIQSQNGKKSSHGLAMIVTQSNKQKDDTVADTNNPISTIPRLTHIETKTENLTLDETEVQRFEGPRKPTMPAKYTVHVVPSLVFLASRQVSLNRIDVVDMHFFKEVTQEGNPGPEYGGYNTRRARDAGEKAKPKTAVVYSPYLDMTPTEPDTMKTAMNQAQKMTQATGQEYTVFTNDQQLYKEVVHITWAEEENFKRLIPRLGGMHLLMSFVGSIGFLMSGSGLPEILASTFAGVPKLLSGKKYPQNVRALRILVEEILRPLFANHDIHTMTQLTQILMNLSAKSRTSRLWVQCLIDPVLIMMAYVRAEREGDWPLHLLAVEKMLPFFFAAGHIHYARYASYYLRSMQRLPCDLLNKFMAGEHVMHHQNGIWNGVWSDLFIESTYMRVGHGPGGIVGSTLNPQTLAIWAYSHNTLCQITQDLKDIADKNGETVVDVHKEERHTRVRDDAMDRDTLRETLSNCVDVFDTSKHPTNGLINVYSGQVIDDPSVNVHDAVELGAQSKRDFENGWPSTFHQKISKNVKTMASVTKGKTHTNKTGDSIGAEFIYARVLGIMASSRDAVSIERLFTHELAAQPLSLFDENGEMRTTKKADLKSRIQVLTQNPPSDLPTVIILDGCAVLWTVSWPAAPAKVGDFVKSSVAAILRRAEGAQVLHVVFDRYAELSTKSCCRISRQKGNSRQYSLTEDCPLPKQSLMLNVSVNKQQLIKMIVKKLCDMPSPANTKVVITGPEPSPVNMGTGNQEEPVTHEEADVLIAYHVIKEAAAGHTSIKVVSDDTDVLVILAHHLYRATNGLNYNVNLYMASCKAGGNLVSVNDVVTKHRNIMGNLLCSHALSGCDTVSAFHGIGKATVLNKLKGFSGVLKLGDLSASMEEILTSCMQFVSMLYGEKPGVCLNSIRASLFRKKISGKNHIPPKLCNLPPTQASFDAHCKRAHLQVALWEAAAEQGPPDMDPLEHGWKLMNSTLHPDLGLDDQMQAPQDVLNLVCCNCKAGCRSGLCTCTKYSVTCTEFCKCKGTPICHNPYTSAQKRQSDGDDDV